MESQLEPLYTIQANTLTGLGDSFGALGKLTQVLVTVANVVATQAPLGPWHLDVTCKYDDYWLWWKEDHFWWNVDFSGSRSVLEGVLQSAETHCQSFLQSYAPLGQWASVTVPATTAKFQATGGLIQQAIDAGSGVTPAQRQAVLASFADLGRELNATAQPLLALIAVFSQFTEQQDGWQADIVSAKEGFVGEAKQTLASISNFINEQPCSGNAWDQYNSFHSQFNTSAETFASSMTALASATQEADSALDLLIGVIDNFASSIGSAVRQLEQAQGTFVLALEQLHFDDALATWNELAREASQLKPPMGQLDRLVNSFVSAPARGFPWQRAGARIASL
jgi:hypothetical protein